MNFNNMKYFIDAAELGSFTKAGRKNYVSQTAVSFQIASMEKELGFPLFLREKNEIRLTQAGKNFYENCCKILYFYNQAVKNASEIAGRKEEVIRIGITGPGDSLFLPEIVSAFQKKYSRVNIKLERDTFYGLKNRLKHNLIDIAFNFSYDIQGESGILIEKLLESKVVLLVSRQHPLAARKIIDPIEAAGEKIIMVSKDYGPANFEHMLEARRMEGYEPVLEIVESVEVLEMYVEMNHGVAFIPKRLFRYNPSRCTTVEIRGSRETNEYVASWMQDNKNKLILPFIEAAREYFREK